jgi:hypothetical protein
MTRHRIVFTLLMISLESACQTQSKSAESSARPTKHPSSNQTCIASGSSVDSTFATEQALRAMAPSELTLAPRLVQPVRDQGIELGLLISLTVTEPRNTVGGGGLVWIDLESGCAIVLRRYE